MKYMSPANKRKAEAEAKAASELAAAKVKWEKERDAAEVKTAKAATALREIIHQVNGRDGVVNCTEGHVIAPGNRYTEDKDGAKTCTEHARN